MTASSNTQHDRYDVAIIGGGMVGLSLACALQKLLKKTSAKNTKILLLESKPLKTDEALQPGFDVRSTVLSFGTVSYLKNLDLWEAIKSRAEAIKTIHVSDQKRFGNVHINAEEADVDALGYVVENQELGLALNKAILAAKGIEVVSPVQVNQISHQQDSALVECQRDKESFNVQASLVVLADGGRSGLSEKLGIYRKQESYNQVAIIANVAFSEAHHNVAYERFTANGPLALLPLGEFENQHRAALVWTQNAEDYTEVFELDDDAFLAKLQQEFGQRLGTFSKVGERAAFPLNLQEAQEQIRHNLVLLGNVAHALHPVAGQGFNLAFRDAMRLAENIAESISAGESPGAYIRLEKYLHATNRDQEVTIAFSDYLTKFFSSKRQTLIWFRKFGLLSIDLLQPFKQILTHQAMGMSGKKIKVS
jgi:2-polyprenyl-6-methoxyphenol 4-hydroxylase